MLVWRSWENLSSRLRADDVTQIPFLTSDSGSVLKEQAIASVAGSGSLDLVFADKMSNELPRVSDAAMINGRILLQAESQRRYPCRYTSSEQVSTLVSTWEPWLL